MFFLIMLIIRGDASRLEHDADGPSSELDDVNHRFGNRDGLAVVWH